MKIYIVVEWDMANYEFHNVAYCLNRERAQVLADQVTLKGLGEYAGQVEEMEIME